MTELRDLVVGWQRGWGVARGLPAATDIGPGLRVHCRQPGRDVEYVATATDPSSLRTLAGLVAGEDAVTWLTVPTGDPAGAAATLEAAGLVLLRRSELLMTADLSRHPRHPPVAPYRLETRLDGAVVTADVRHDSGDLGASGTMGLTGPDAVADRIETSPAHRRRGLASAVMSALAGAALAGGAHRGLLVASEDGQRLYPRLGWQPAAEVLIATTPGNTYPS